MRKIASTLILTIIALQTTGCTRTLHKAIKATETFPATSQNTRIATYTSRSITPTPRPTFTLPPTTTPSPTVTASATPLFIFNLGNYDPDIYQPIEVEHIPPLIARADETVLLAFNPINTIYCQVPQRYCRLEPVLYYTYGDAEAVDSMMLTYEIVNEFESLVTRLPATNQAGEPLRYYAVFSVPEAGYSLRYPVGGSLELFTTANFIRVELPAEKAVAPGDRVINFFWGYGPDKVRSTFYSPYNRRAGPPALDVAQDGRIALMDPVNERVVIFDPKDQSYSSLPLPFTYKFNADLGFDQEGRLMVCDFMGEEVDGVFGLLPPTCYRLLPDGQVETSAPVYTKFPVKITQGHHVLDTFDYHLVAPFNSAGQANSRETQRNKLTWELPYHFVAGAQGFDPNTALFADVTQGQAFEVHCTSPLGVILGFERTPQGYLMIFSNGYETIRATWIDPAGVVLKDITLPNGQFSEMSLGGQTAVGKDGALYVLSATQKGIEVHIASAPEL